MGKAMLKMDSDGLVNPATREKGQSPVQANGEHVGGEHVGEGDFDTNGEHVGEGQKSPLG